MWSALESRHWWEIAVPVWVVVAAVVVVASAAFAVGLLVAVDDKPSTPAPAQATYFGGHGDSYFGKP